jgi:uncharacterized phage protein gp47/JayE
MAYEHMTYEVILQRMLDRVTANYPDLDTREGSIIYNAVAPAAVELAIMYTELDNVLLESFVGTASREYLFVACEQMGMDTLVFNATTSTHKGIFNVEVPIGSRWNCDLYNYTVDEYLGQEANGYYTYKMDCDTTGTEPNNHTGNLTAITDIPAGLTVAKITECLIEGENEVSDDDIRQRYYDYVNSVVVDGNVKQYEQWCSEYEGIGNAKIIPLWNGDNTVKVSILSASNKRASDELIAEFQEYLDPGIEGMGNGVAPIGAFVTVTTATERQINITATVTMKNGYSDTTAIDKAVSDYFDSISYEKVIVPYMNVGATILAAEGVEAVTNLTINGGTADITLGNEEIPVLGTVNWVVK